MKNEVIEIILRTAAELQQTDQVALDRALDENSELFGEHGALDSMGLVSLVVAVEQAIEEKYSRTVSLADEKALSMKNSPYRTVRSLAEYAVGQLEKR